MVFLNTMFKLTFLQLQYTNSFFTRTTVGVLESALVLLDNALLIDYTFLECNTFFPLHMVEA